MDYENSAKRYFRPEEGYAQGNPYSVRNYRKAATPPSCLRPAPELDWTRG